VKQRGRPSSASLEILPSTHVLDRVPRQTAPHELSDEETEIWASVVNSEPADWFSPSTIPALVQYCRHVVHARRIAELLDKALSDPALAVTDYQRLLKMQEVETRALLTLMTKMRLSQQSTTNHRGNKKPGATRKPWEG
jgi:hypothetical protein